MSGPNTTAEGQGPDMSPQSPSSWFGSMFGQCCKGPPVEGELRFEDLAEDKKKKKKEKKDKAAGKSPAKDKGKEKKEKSNTTPGATRYKVDNSILQIENRPGVAYRYSKRETDKVKNGHGPAKWNEIVEGIDEGDGWLKVGEYYLPMMYQGIAVVTPVDPSVSSGLELDSIKTKHPEPKSHPAPGKSSTPTATSPLPTVDKKQEEPKQVVPKQDSQPPKEVASPPKATPEKIEPEKSPAPQPEITTKKSVGERGVAVDAGNWAIFDAPIKLDVAKTQEATGVSQSEQATSKFNTNEWRFRPSVGTWLQTAPKAQQAAQVAEIKEIAFYHLPSVGTWYQKRRFAKVGGDDLAEQEAKAALKLKEIEAFGADMDGMCGQEAGPSK